METINIVYIIINLAAFAILVITTIMLTKQALKAKSAEIGWLILGYMLLMAYFIVTSLRLFGINVPYVVGIPIFQSVIICMFVFFHELFYKGRSSPFKWILPTAISVALVLVVIGYFRDQTPEGTSAYDLIRWLHTVVDAGQIGLGMACQSILSLRAYRQHRSSSYVQQHVVNRYFFFCVAGIALGTTVLVDPIGTWLSITGELDFRIVRVIISFLLLSYGLAMYMTWTMPRWFQRFVNRIRVVPGAADQENLLTSQDIMAVVDFLGGTLASSIKQSPAAAKGFLLVALESETRDSGKQFLSLLGLRRFINTTLKEKLRGLVADIDAEDVVRALDKKLLENQSLLVMLSL